MVETDSPDPAFALADGEMAESSRADGAIAAADLAAQYMARIDYVARAKALADAAIKQPPPGDDEKAVADALLALARENGLLAVVVPPEFGGPGLDIGDVARIAFHLARASGSLGLTYAMHMSQALTVVRHATGNALFADFQRRMVADQILIASGTSEKGVGGDIFGSKCTVEPAAGGGFTITKDSPNISYIDHAGAVLVTAMKAGKGPRPRQVLVLAETADIDFTPGREAGFLGMRGILNRSYALEARFSPDAIFAPAYPVIARETMTPSIHIFWAALWSGLAARALEKARAFVAAAVPADSEIGQVTRYQLSQLVDRHHQLNAMIRDAVTDHARGAASNALDFAFAARINRLKISGSELLIEIVVGAMKVIGIQAYALAGPYSLSAELRDCFSAPIMVSNFRLAMNNARIESYVAEGV